MTDQPLTVLDITEREHAVVEWKLEQVLPPAVLPENTVLQDYPIQSKDDPLYEGATKWLARNIDEVGEAEAVRRFKNKAARWAAAYDAAQ